MLKQLKNMLKAYKKMGSTNIKKRDNMKDCINSIWRQIKYIVTNSTNQVLEILYGWML